MFKISIALVALFLIAIFLYSRSRQEGFSTVALNTSNFPACVTRDADAQKLLTLLKSENTTFEELSLIVSKLLCMDADITSYGAGVYASLRLPFNTHHDMEPVGTFVGRCLKNAVKERDISLTLGKLQDRGTILIAMLCSNSAIKAEAVSLFDGIVKRTQENITKVCLKEHASMDVPAGVRDPGYFIPATLSNIGPYQNTAPKYNFN